MQREKKFSTLDLSKNLAPLMKKKIRIWVTRVLVSLTILTAFMQLASLTAFMHLSSMTAVKRPRLMKSWRSPCFHCNVVVNSSTNNAVTEVNAFGGTLPSPRALLPEREYKSNGYLLLSCNGGLNQMRAGISDMVTIARYLNMTLVVPELDKRSFWGDTSNFEDIFNVDHFINSLRDEVKIIRRLPEEVIAGMDNNEIHIYSMPPVSWSDMTYYFTKILPLARRHQVIRFEKTDTRLANNALPLSLQQLRCRVNYDALIFTPSIEALAEKLVSILEEKSNNYFVALHLRYEMDMLSFSGCSHGCTDEEADELKRKRYLVDYWKEKDIDPEQRRFEGRCPLTPEETALVLRALGFPNDTTMYIAAGTIYGAGRRLAALKEAYPNAVDKEILLSPEDLRPLRDHSNQMAALDYLVAIKSDVFIPSYDGNMAKVVEGHRRQRNFSQTVILNRKILVEYLDLYIDGAISWDQFSSSVKKAHKDRWGQPTDRKVIPGQPKVEDYFYANPQECLNNFGLR